MSRRNNMKSKESEAEELKDVKGKSPSNNRRSSKPHKGYTKREIGKGKNDITWHAKSAQLLRDAAAIPWSWATGKPIRRTSPLNNSITPETQYILPGVEVIRTVLTPGCGSKGTDAINLAAQALYTDIRRELKSANAYEGSDVIIYLMAVSEIIAFVSWCTRLLGTIMSYSFANRYLPYALIKAQGVDPNDIMNHPAEFRNRINIAIAKASQIWIPKGFDFLTRARWEYANYYSEGENIKDQLYMMTPGLFRKYEYDPESDYAGSLKPFIFIGGFHDEHLLTCDELVTALETMIDALVGDTDFQNIAGDLYNRYGAGGVEPFALIPENAIIQPVFSIEVLEQMMNAKCVYPIHWMYYFASEDDKVRFFKINQDEAHNRLIIPHIVTLDRTIDTKAYNYSLIDSYTTMLNVHDNPSDEKTMLISRMSNLIYDINAVGSNKFEFYLDVAAEWVVGYEYISFTGEALDTLKMYAAAQVLPAIGDTESNFDERFVAMATSFHYKPMMFRAAGTTGNDVHLPDSFAYGEQDIVAPISDQQLMDLNRVDLMSLFAVPDVGQIVK